MTKEIYEEIKSLLESKEELVHKEIMFTPSANEVYIVERKYNELGGYTQNEKEKLNYDELSVLRKYINEEIDRIKERLKELGYYD